MTTMSFYVARNSDGLIHVTNTIGGMIGQHHVHDEADFEQWKAGSERLGPVPTDAIKELGRTPDCDCGLKSGEAKQT